MVTRRLSWLGSKQLYKRCWKLNCCCFDIDAVLSCGLIKRSRISTPVSSFDQLYFYSLNHFKCYICSVFVLCTIATLYIFLFLDFFTNLFVVNVNIHTSAATKLTLIIQILYLSNQKLNFQ